jgi:hypothetical protein
MEQNVKDQRTRNWMTSVLTDVHLWVPVAVLAAGLILLKLVH